MSQITVAQAKRYLRVIGTADDELLQDLIDSAEQEACRFLNRENLPTLPLEYPAESSSEGAYSEEVPSSEDPVAPDAREGVILLVKASYEATTPAEIDGYRKAAEAKLQPYRRALGV
jgi:hypothetical protein